VKSTLRESFANNCFIDPFHINASRGAQALFTESSAEYREVELQRTANLKPGEWTRASKSKFFEQMLIFKVLNITN